MSGTATGWPGVAVWPSPATFWSCVGTCATVTSACAEASPALTVTIVAPLPVAVTRPDELTVTTAAFAEVHARAGESIALPFWSVIVAVSWAV